MAKTANSAKVGSPAYSIDSVDSALRILRLLCDVKEIRVSEVADHLQVAQSTAHRLLSMLVHHGYAQQAAKRGGYRPGPQFLQMGFAAIRDLDVRQFARPVLQELWVAVNETVHLAVPYGQDIFYVDGIESGHQLRIGLRVGDFLPANCIALGKALLAALPDQEVCRIFPMQELPSLTQNSVLNREQLLVQLAEIRDAGFARSFAESDAGVGSVAIAVLDREGSPRAAISVSAPLLRITPESEESWVEALRTAAESLQARLWGGPEPVGAGKNLEKN